MPFTTAGVSILGVAAAAGKSGVSVGVLRALSRAGVAVAPFKAVAVVNLADDQCPEPDVWRRGVYYNAFAADRPVEWWHNPVTVIPAFPGAREGSILIAGTPTGETPIVTDDQIDASRLSATLRRACIEAIHAGLDRVHADADVVVLEGAGAAGDLPPDADLANIYAPIHAGHPVVLVAKLPVSGHLAALAGLHTLLPTSLQQKAIGYLLNKVDDPAWADTAAARVTHATGWTRLGTLPTIDYPPGFDGSPAHQRVLDGTWADQVTATGLLRHLNVPLPA
jgi:adenosylcobyric acid synthase